MFRHWRKYTCLLETKRSPRLSTSPQRSPFLEALASRRPTNSVLFEGERKKKPEETLVAPHESALDQFNVNLGSVGLVTITRPALVNSDGTSQHLKILRHAGVTIPPSCPGQFRLPTSTVPTSLVPTSSSQSHRPALVNSDICCSRNNAHCFFV